MAQLIHKAVFFDLGLTLLQQNTTRWNTGAKTLLANLRAAGVRLGVISNTGAFSRAQLLAQLPPDFTWNAFNTELILLSSEVNLVKPELAIFRLALAKAALPAGECLYCSEDLVELLAAQRVGMNIARVLPPPNSDLNKLEAALRQVAALP